MSPVSLLVGLTPVVLFLLALILMDSYKLVSRRSVLLAIGAGVGSAGLVYVINRFLLQVGMDETVLRRGVAPFVEESVKALYIVYLIQAARVGFLVDAAILGFAVGTGFALVENVYYAESVPDAGLGLWVIRGLGTAVMHGSATAVVAILSRSLTERRRSAGLELFLPGILLAAVAHAIFNQFILSPIVSTLAMLIAMPLFVGLVFERSDRATADWLHVGLDTEVEMLQAIETGAVEETPVGIYLKSLNRLPGPMVADMLCLVRIRLELSLRAKGVLIARAAGVDLPPDEEVRANFEEMRFLERSIGRTGKMAIQPFLRTSHRDLWQLHMLGK